MSALHNYIYGQNVSFQGDSKPAQKTAGRSTILIREKIELTVGQGRTLCEHCNRPTPSRSKDNTCNRCGNVRTLKKDLDRYTFKPIKKKSSGGTTDRAKLAKLRSLLSRQAKHQEWLNRITQEINAII